MPIHPKKLHKPYRIRHMGLFAAGVIAVILAAFSAGYILGDSSPAAVTSSNQESAESVSTSARPNQLWAIRSATTRRSLKPIAAAN